MGVANFITIKHTDEGLLCQPFEAILVDECFLEHSEVRLHVLLTTSGMAQCCPLFKVKACTHSTGLFQVMVPRCTREDVLWLP